MARVARADSWEPSKVARMGTLVVEAVRVEVVEMGGAVCALVEGEPVLRGVRVAAALGGDESW